MIRTVILLLSAAGLVGLSVSQPIPTRLRTHIVRPSTVQEYVAHIETSTNNAPPWIIATSFRFADSSSNGQKSYRVRLEPVDYYVPYTNKVKLPVTNAPRTKPPLPVK